jgi:hypothetical protein
MKALAALMLTGLLAAGTGVTAAAEEENARLSDPATTGADQKNRTARVPPQERPGDSAVPEPARPLGLSRVERDGIRTAIRGQLRALALRDAEAAYSYLAPAAKDFFETPDAFLSTLAEQVKPLTKARSFTFFGMEREATDAVQKVVLAEPGGREWLARFTLERQPDGGWGIKACKVEPLAGDRS